MIRNVFQYVLESFHSDTSIHKQACILVVGHWVLKAESVSWLMYPYKEGCRPREPLGLKSLTLGKTTLVVNDNLQE